MSTTEPEAQTLSGSDTPRLRSPPPGPATRAWLARNSRVSVPMGPRPSARGELPRTLVMARGYGSNVLDVDDNRYVDLAAGFGALLLGHSHPRVTQALTLQAARLAQALGDVYSSDTKIELLERLAALYPEPSRALLAQSGSDAVSAALKTAALVSGKPGVIAFNGAYHGLGYGPLSACGLRTSYRAPFSDQLNPHVAFIDYPSDANELERVLGQLTFALSSADVGAILVEPILGRGGVVLPPRGFLRELAERAASAGALLIADEVWTGLGRAGKLLFSLEETTPDLVCLGKGLGGGLPVSALIGRARFMQSWSREHEVVHTSTFAGAPLAARSALTTLDVIEDEALVARSHAVGERFRRTLGDRLAKLDPKPSLRGAGLMLAVDLAELSVSASKLQELLLEKGFITSTGGGQRDVLVLTPALNIEERLLVGFADALVESLAELCAGHT